MTQGRRVLYCFFPLKKKECTRPHHLALLYRVPPPCLHAHDSAIACLHAPHTAIACLHAPDTAIACLHAPDTGRSYHHRRKHWTHRVPKGSLEPLQQLAPPGSRGTQNSRRPDSRVCRKNSRLGNGALDGPAITRIRDVMLKISGVVTLMVLRAYGLGMS